MRLFTHTWGHPTAPAVVCLHGIRGHGLVFRRLAEQCLETRFRVISLDLRGHGRSPWEPPWDLSSQLDDLQETADTLGIDAAVWLGHSFGARLVMELDARSPERVERAVLLDPAIWVPPPVALERAELERADRSFASVEEAIEERTAYSRLLHTPSELIEEDVTEHLIRGKDGRFRYRYCSPAVTAAFGEMAKQPPAATSIHAPTLLVRGAETDVTVEALVQPYRDVLEVVTVPGGHNVLWDAFEETAAAVDAFL